MLLKMLLTMVLSWGLISNLYAQVGPGGYTPRSVQKVTDGTTTCYPYQLTFSSISSCTGGNAVIANGSSSGGTNYWPQTGNNIYNNNTGNVGINTTTASGGSNVGIGSASPGANLDIYNASGNNVLRVTEGGFTPLFVSSAGTVGIGTANPDSTVNLDVDGPVSVHNGKFTFSTNISTGFLVQDHLGNQLFQLGDEVLGNPLTFSAPKVTFGSSSVNTVNSIWINENVGIGTYNPPIGGLAVMSGNVGIGTWEPTFILQSMGNIGVGTYTVCTTQGLCPTGGGGGTNYWPQTGNNIYNNNTGNVGINTTTASGGSNVGIGTQAPGTALDVQGTVRMLGISNAFENMLQNIQTQNMGGAG